MATKNTVKAPVAEDIKAVATNVATAVKAEVAEKAPKVKSEIKAAAKATKSAVKNTTKKAATATKAAVKKDKLFLQFAGKEINTDEIVESAKADYKSANKGVIRSIDVYLKPEDSAAYYVVNGKVSGKVDI